MKKVTTFQKIFWGTVVFGLGVIVLGGTTLAILITVDACQRQKQNPAQYDAYLCYDYHLECIQSGDFLGRCDRDIHSIDYICSYWSIKDLPDDEFVFATFQLYPPMGLLGQSYDYYILQNPEKKVDVLHEWNIKEIQLCHLESGRDSKSNKMKDPTYSVIKASKDSTVIRQFCDLTSAETAESYESFDSEKYEPIGYKHDQSFTLCVVFEETESLVWICHGDIYRSIYQSEDGKEGYVITLDLGTESEDFQENRNSVVIDNWKELQIFILQALELR